MRLRKRWQRVTAIIFGILLLLLLFIFLFDWSLTKGFIERKASEITQRTVKIGDLDVRFSWGLVPTITADRVYVSNMPSGSDETMLTADRVNLKLDLRSIFTEQQDFPLLELHNANLLLERDKDNNANWDFGNKDEKKNSKPPVIGELILRKSTMKYKVPNEGTDLTVTADSGADFRKKITDDDTRDDFIILKGDGKYKKAPFNIDFAGASVLDLQSRTEPYPLKTSVTIAHTQINVEGTILDPANLQGMNITLNVKGASASDIFPIFGIALPPTPPYSLTGKLDYEDKVWKFNNFQGRIGDSDITGNLTWDTSLERPKLMAKFLSKNLNFKDLGGLIGVAPPADEALTPEQKAKLAKQKSSPYVIPDAPLDISRLKAMDADVEFTGKKVISPSLPLDDFFMKLELNNSLLKVNPVKFGTANGDVLANLTINARKEPVRIDSDFQFHKLALSRLFESMPVGNKGYNQGYIGGRAILSGTGKSLRKMLASSDGSIGVGMEGGQLSNLLVELMGLDVAESLGFILAGDKPVPIRCVIGDFDVKNGLMKSKTLIIDTNDTNVKGEGTISLDSEKMDIVLRARPKDQSILSLKSPIHITGTLKNPNVGIDAEELLVRGGLGAAASVVLTPFVAAIAFVEPGLGKDSNCAQLIREVKMNSDAGNLIPKNKNAPVPAANTKAPEASKASKVGNRKSTKAPVTINQPPPLQGMESPANH